MARRPSQGSTTTDISLPDSLFSKLSGGSETESSINEPARTSGDALARGSQLKGGGMDSIPDSVSSPASDHVRELKQQSSTAIP